MSSLSTAVPFFNKNKQETIDKETKKDNKDQQEKQSIKEIKQPEKDVVSSYIADEISFELK